MTTEKWTAILTNEGIKIVSAKPMGLAWIVDGNGPEWTRVKPNSAVFETAQEAQADSDNRIAAVAERTTIAFQPTTQAAMLHFEEHCQ
jgi:hypothetical protein